MADVTITTTTNGLTADRYSQYYSKVLLKHAIQRERLAELCSKYDLPSQKGSTTLRLFKRSEASADTVETLTEGTVTTNYSNGTLTAVDIPLTQHSEKVKISDIRSDTDLINQLNLEVERMGEAAALFVDKTIRDEIFEAICYNGTTAITDSGFNTFCGVGNFDAKTEAELETQWDVFKALSAADAKIKVSDLKSSVTQLRKKRATPFSGGYYVAALAPEQIHDLQSDSQWNAVNVYQKKGEQIFKGEVGMISGVKVVDWTVPFIQDKTAGAFGTYAASGDVFTGFVFGQQAVGCAKLAGSTSAMKPTFKYVTGGDKTDPMDQYSIAGWKGYFAAKVLDANWVTAIHSQSTFS